MTPTRPPLALSILLTQANGNKFRLDPDHPDAAKQPYNLSFQTTKEGFGDASFSLSREAGHDSSDITILNDSQFIGQDGSVAYQGRLASAPSAQTLDVTAEGWVSALKQREDLTALIIDRDATQFGSISQTRQEVLSDGGGTLDKSITGSAQNGTLNFTGDSGSAVPSGARGELAYLAPLNCLIATLEYLGAEANLTNIAAASAIFVDGDMVTNQDSQSLTLDNTRRYVNGTTPKRAVVIPSVSTATTTPAAGSGFRRSISPGVWGDHGLTRWTRDDGLRGVVASDLIKYLVATFAPKINTSRVTNTTYPIPHAVWRDGSTLQAMLQQINSYHSWRLAIWENRMLEFGPYDYGKADWKCANGINGVRVELTGDTNENQFNGCVVNYVGFDGVPAQVGPTTSSDLRDDSDWIAANQWGDQAYLPITIEWNCSQADAILIGAIALADANRAQRPCQITIPYHAQTVNGTWEQAWKVRADQTIAVMNEAFPGPRLITETSWNSNEVVITCDNAINTLEALQARIVGALAANGIGGAG